MWTGLILRRVRVIFLVPNGEFGRWNSCKPIQRRSCFLADNFHSILDAKNFFPLAFTNCLFGREYHFWWMQRTEWCYRKDLVNRKFIFSWILSYSAVVKPFRLLVLYFVVYHGLTCFKYWHFSYFSKGRKGPMGIPGAFGSIGKRVNIWDLCSKVKFHSHKWHTKYRWGFCSGSSI